MSTVSRVQLGKRKLGKVKLSHLDKLVKAFNVQFTLFPVLCSSPMTQQCFPPSLHLPGPPQSS